MEFNLDITYQNHYLCGRDVLDGTLFLQIPYDHKTSPITYNNLVWVDWVLL